MRMKGARLPGALAAAGLAFGLAFLLWALLGEQAWWGRTLAWIMDTQAGLHRRLAQAMRLVGEEGWIAALPLIGLSFLYGVFHAAGPGHGKAVMTAYLGTHRVRPARGLLLATAAALMQGAVAVLLVEVVADLLGYSLRHTQRAGTHLENLSFALVALLGAMLALQGAAALYRRWRGPRPDAPPRGVFTQGAGMRAYCADCGALHDLAGAHLDGTRGWRASLPVVAAIGIRPCSGAILVLLVAYSIDLRWAGIAAVMAMSAGTAATVGALAIGAVSLRGGLMGLLGRGRGASRRMRAAFEVLGLLGGLCIFLMGVGLLQQGLRTPAHPLL
ncbi:nickel/cobalt transporter [Castellaniella defragrans]|uniref:nickel/cobalt transporter n=1 Tax=Castellaniella defragrans TaxID=75697 RepID=UPI0023F376F6|nr:hypothetical protein [Castellaniella defragrans]